MAENDDQGGPDRALIALLVFIAIAIGGWFLVKRLSDAKRLQDCIQSGRRNCLPIDSEGNAAERR